MPGGIFTRTAMRAALAAYLQDAVDNREIPWLAEVYPHAAKITPMGDLASDNPNAGDGIGAGLWIKLEESHERRVALGHKIKTYTVQLDVILLSYQTEAEVAEAANDDLLDGLEGVIVNDRNAGTGATGTGTDAVWQWGEGEGPMGGTDIHVACGYPTVRNGSRVELRSRVTVAASQFLTG